MAETVTGIVGSQKMAREGATTARNTRKGRYRKYGSYAAGLVAFLVLLYTFTSWLDDRPKLTAPASSQSIKSTPRVAASNAPTGVVTWSRLEPDGTIPVNVWSQELQGRPGCSVTVTHDSRIVSQYRNKSADWFDYTDGTSPDFTAMRFIATESGVTPPPYSFKCR